MFKLAAGIVSVVSVIGLSVIGIAAVANRTVMCGPGVTASSLRAETYDAAQVGNAATIVAVGRQLGIPRRGWVIAVAAALQESSLHTIDHGDDDSVGLFQQRPSHGWGSPTQLLDPSYAAEVFYRKLVTIADWQTMPLTRAAQQVQHSAYPDAYAKWEPDAAALVADAISGNPSTIPPDVMQCISSCPSLTASPDRADKSCGETKVVFARPQSWLTSWSGGPVPYLSSNAPDDLFHGYRRDCSGYVSMALGLPGPGLTTIDLARRSMVISAADLRPGDLLINPDTDLRGHVVLFAGWTDTSMKSYRGYEQSGDAGTHYRTIPYPYFGSYSMTPYRMRLGTLSGE